MPRTPHVPRALTAIAVGTLVVGGLAGVVPTAASGTTPRGLGTVIASSNGHTTSVTVLLKAPNQAGLDRLANRHGLSHAERVADLARLLPGAAAHRTVSAELRKDGFTVTHQTAWTIDAHAASPKVTAVFGATPPPSPVNASADQLARAAGALPKVPASIAPLTAAVLPTTGGPKLFSPLATCHACRNGDDFRNAYTAPNVTPTTGHDRNGALTIATLQFAGWNKQDLSTYAASVGMKDPVASGQFTQIPVDGLKVPKATTSEHEADEEVDLDQETILSTDPSANQRAYFDTNANKAGYADALGQVLADVTQSKYAIDGGDPKIAALSTSWGTCESEFSKGFAFPHDTVTAIEDIMKSLTAAGVTVFAASGDDGVYDCGNFPSSTKVAVDYPASSPEVVGVGGTRLKLMGHSSPNTGTNWSDAGWSCTSAHTCQGSGRHDTGGSGGGESILKSFRQPTYQAAGIGDQPFTTSTGKKGNFGTQPRRLVPDIADDGDPNTAFGVVTTDPIDDRSCDPFVPGCRAKTFVIGGTSLSSPEATALFTDMLGRHGARAGVGDIHGALYSAYAAHRGAFRDVTSGRNGHQKDVDAKAAKHNAQELPVSAQPGYDTVTGLGAPLWPRIAPFIFHPRAPKAIGHLSLANPHSRRHPDRLTATWTGRQVAKAGSAAASATVTITRKGTKKPVYHRAAAPASGTHTFIGTPGRSYVLTVKEHDLAGQHSTTFSTPLQAAPLDDRNFLFHGSWRRLDGRSDFGGSLATTDVPGAYARAAARGRSYKLRVRTGPAYGKLAIYHGGKKVTTVDLYSPSVGHEVIPVFGDEGSPLKTRRFTFRYIGEKSGPSTAATIDLDALYVLR